MTPVLFHFITPDGVPLANARVDIQLSRSSYDEDHDGVLMPRLVEATTDEDGKVTVELAPADVLYHVECWDTDSEAGLSYKFMVPEQEVPNTPIRLQDIVIVGEMSNTSYDEAALIAIHAAKATALTAAISATASAAAADASADIAAAAVDEINGHMADPTGAHAASAISNTPAGGISATTVQAAINELDTEKARLDGATFSGAVSATGFTGPLTGDVTGNVSGSAGSVAAANLTGTTLAANVVSASLNSITPTGGTLAMNGSIRTVGGNRLSFDTTGIDGSNFLQTVDDFNLRLYNGRGSTSYLDVALDGQRFGVASTEVARFTSIGLALTGIQTITATSASPALSVTGTGTSNDIAYVTGNGWFHADGNADPSFGNQVPGSGLGIALGTNRRANGTAESQIAYGTLLGGPLVFSSYDGTTYTERMELSATGHLSLTGRQSITANTMSFALDVDNSNAGGYGVRIRSAGVGGEPPLAIMSADGSTTVAQIKNNGSFFGLSGVFSYGLDLSNNTGVIHFQDTGGTQRRTILRASDQIIFGDVDNSTTDSYVSFCANLSQRHVINNSQIGVWTAAGVSVTGVLAASKAAGGAGLTLDASAGTADTGMDIRWLRGGVLKWQLGSGYATGGDNLDFYDRGGGDRLVWQAVPNGAFNILVPTNVASDLTVSAGGHFKITAAPTSSAGLPAGTVWNDGGTLKIA